MLKRIGRYINLQPMDGGGMGQVFLAEHEILPGTFVVKLLQAAMQGDSEAIERFKRECIVMSRIQHPNIVHCLEPGEENGTWYLPMEWIRGETLSKKIDKAGSIPLRERIGWALQMLGGLDAAHTAKPKPVIHRDLKPSNIMVTQEGVVKILDFGIAHEAGSNLTRASNPGTPEFQAPEQIMNGALDARTDLFSLGIVLHMLFTGRHPFKKSDSQSDFETQNAIVNAEPEPLTDIDPALPPRLSDIILKTLRKKPDERFASALELRKALENLYQAPDRGAEDEKREFALRQVERAEKLCDLGGAENVVEAVKFVANALALIADLPEALLMRERVHSLQAEIERVEVLFAKAREALQAQQFREARSCLDLALSFRPNDSRLRKLQTELRAREAAAAAAGSASGVSGARGGESAEVAGVVGSALTAGATGAAGAAGGDGARGASDPRLRQALEMVAAGRRGEAGALLEAMLFESPGDLAVLEAARAAGFAARAERALAWAPEAGAIEAEIAAVERSLGSLAAPASSGRAGAADGTSNRSHSFDDTLHRCHTALEAAALAAAGLPGEVSEILGARIDELREALLRLQAGRRGATPAPPADLLARWVSP